MKIPHRLSALALIAVLSLAAQGPPFATEARVTINQAKALTGGVTPGDAPGFPVLITKGGSYLLTSDLDVPTLNTGGILIRTPDPVTINLNGFTVRGPNRCGKNYPGGCESIDSGSGIETDVATGTNTNGSTVYGGAVTGFGRIGVGMLGFGNTIREMTVMNCKIGIQVTGLIHDNIATRNGGVGIISFGAVVRNNSTTENAGDGIFLFRGTAMDNTSENNTGFGFQSLNAVSVGTPIPAAGYRGNFFAGNNAGGAQVSGGIPLGQNVCGASACP
ncbi:MAG: hypothetical protein KIT83_00055 [Bryobacterales bacterium]|nr:hypothetical protein [Bryobacterales bacterium]